MSYLLKPQNIKSNMALKSKLKIIIKKGIKKIKNSVENKEFC